MRMGWIAALAGSFAVGSCSLDPYAELTEIDLVAHSPRAADCGACHVDIHREFAESRHATAFIDPAFLEATANHTFTDCLGCHAPASIYVTGIPQLRTLHREEGVTCVACHFDGEALAGPAPFSALLSPHPTAEERPLYRSSELCGKCHEGTFREWRESPLPTLETKRSCQECHMRPVERKLTQPTDIVSSVLVAYEDRFAGRAHTFRVDAIEGLDGAFEARWIRDASNSTPSSVELVSRVPHLVPTGDFGFRRVDVVIESLDADMNVIDSTRESLFKEIGSALETGVPRVFAVAPVESATATRLRILASRGADPGVVVFEQEWKP